jgi:hypothetical protein
MNNKQYNALYGPASLFSEYEVGDAIQFRFSNEIKAGKVLHVCDGKPLLYIVDSGEGFPEPVESSRIIQGSFTAILASYGASMNGCMLSRKAAENLSVNVVDQIIETEQGRLRVLSARLEGDERQGQVIAQCEAAEVR